MNIENFDTFVSFFLEKGYNINAKNEAGKSFTTIINEHRHGKPYFIIMKKYGGN
jgi:uncharacterized protein YvpB